MALAPLVVELPGIEPDAPPGNMPSELPVRSISFRFSPGSLPRVSFSGLDGVKRKQYHIPDTRKARRDTAPAPPAEHSNFVKKCSADG